MHCNVEQFSAQLAVKCSLVKQSEDNALQCSSVQSCQCRVVLSSSVQHRAVEYSTGQCRVQHRAVEQQICELQQYRAVEQQICELLSASQSSPIYCVFKRSVAQNVVQKVAWCLQANQTQNVEVETRESVLQQPAGVLDFERREIRAVCYILIYIIVVFISEAIAELRYIFAVCSFQSIGPLGRCFL